MTVNKATVPDRVIEKNRWGEPITLIGRVIEELKNRGWEIKDYTRH